MRIKSMQHIMAGLVLAALALSSVAAGAPSQGNPSISLRGTVYNDANGNGHFDAGEQGLPDVGITVSSGGTIFNFTTGDDGTYGPTLGAGFWTISVVVPAGWSATTATQQSVSVDNGKVATGLDFGLKQGAGSAKSSTSAGSTSSSPSDLPTTGGESQPSALPLLALLLVVCAGVVLALTLPQSKSARK